MPIRLELFRYDNRANPQDVNSEFEWGLRTSFNHVGLAADLVNRGSVWKAEYDEQGWSVMVAGKRERGPITGLVELLRVRGLGGLAGQYAGQATGQGQTQLQTEVRMHW